MRHGYYPLHYRFKLMSHVELPLISTYDNRALFMMEYPKQFLILELDKLTHFLENCKKTAVALPTFVSYELVKKLEQNGYANVYQGLETFFEVSIAFSLSGRVPQYLIQRAKYAELCGLWKRWQTCVQAEIRS